MEARLIETSVPKDPEGVVLVLHGGASALLSAGAPEVRGVAALAPGSCPATSPPSPPAAAS